MAALALMAVAAALGLYGLGSQPLWNDEAFSFFVAWQDVGHTLHFMRQDPQPPLYYLLLTGWLKLGHGPAMLRGLSVLAAVSCVPLLLDAGTRLVGRPAALLGTALFVLDPAVLIWGQRARPYALQTLFVALAFWGFARIWRGGARAPLVAWGAWVAGGAAAMMTQYPAGFFLLGVHVAMAVRWLRAPRAEAALLARWVLAQLAMAALWLPWLGAFAGQVAEHLTPGRIAAEHGVFLISAAKLRSDLGGLLSVATLWRGQALFLALFLGLAALGAVALWRRRAGLPVLAPVVVPLVVCLGGFALVHPVFGYVTINFVWLLLPYCLLVAAGVMALPRPAALAMAALLLLGDAWGARNVYLLPSPPIDQAAAAMAAALRQGDAVMLSRTAATRFALAYGLGPPFVGRVRGLDVSDAPAAGWPIRDAAGLEGVSRLWLVLPEGEEPAIAPAALPAGFRPALERRFGPILLARYDRASEGHP